MAALWALPVLYVCENNLYNEYTPAAETTAGTMVARPAAFGVPAVEVDGQDVRAVYDAAHGAARRARSGGGPTFLLAQTYRYFGHHVGDVDRSYRPRDEEARWRTERDPLPLLAGWLAAEGGATADALAQIEQEVRATVAAGRQFALDAPYPEPGEVDRHV